MSHRKNTRSLAFKLVAGGIAVVVIPLLVVGLFSVTRSSKALETLGQDQARQVAADLASMTELVLEEELKLAEQLALNSGAVAALEKAADGEAAASAETASFQAYLGRVMKKHGDFYEVILLAGVDNLCPQMAEFQRHGRSRPSCPHVDQEAAGLVDLQ